MTKLILDHRFQFEKKKQNKTYKVPTSQRQTNYIEV